MGTMNSVPNIKWLLNSLYGFARYFLIQILFEYSFLVSF